MIRCFSAHTLRMAFGSMDNICRAAGRRTLPICRERLTFLGQNFYDCTLYSAKNGMENPPDGAMRNSAGWNVTPDGIGWAMRFLYERYHMPILITENGMCCHDWVALKSPRPEPHRLYLAISAKCTCGNAGRCPGARLFLLVTDGQF